MGWGLSPPHYFGKAGAHVFWRRATGGILTSHSHLFNIEFVEIIYQPGLPPGPGEAGQSSAAGAQQEARDARSRRKPIPGLTGSGSCANR